MPKLTIGMCTYDDFYGTNMTVQSLILHHRETMNDVDFVVVDNNPDSSHGKETKSYMDASVPNGKYIPFTEYSSTATRNLVFDNEISTFTFGDYTPNSIYVICIIRIFKNRHV